MTDLYDRGEHIDPVMLANVLQRQGQLESVDGLSYLISLDGGLPHIFNHSYIGIIRTKRYYARQYPPARKS
jgi:replicative DNA helicase